MTVDANIRSRALLVTLNIGRWEAAKLDRKATSDTLRANYASENAGRFTKQLFPGCDLLSAIKSHANAVRQTFYQNVLAWGIDGTFLLPTKNYIEYMDKFRQQRDQYMDRLVPDFLREYPNLQAEAQRRLGDLYSHEDYPSPLKVAAKFYMDISEYPLPSSDFRLDLSDDVTDRIRANLEASLRAQHATAMRDAWQRLYDKVKHAADKLSDPSAIFRDSLIENIRETCAVLTRLNITDDPAMEAMRSEVEYTLARSNPEALRVDARMRQDAADTAADIVSRISNIMEAL